MFPGAASLKMLRERRSGRWGDITGGISPPTNTTTYERTYLTQWFDYGINPSGATYRYVLLPNASSSATQAYSASPSVDIVTLNSSVHFVNGGALRLKMANFWVDGAAPAQGLDADRKCSLVLHGFLSGGDDLVEIAVADPTQTQTGDILVQAQVAGPIATDVSLDEGVTVESLGSGARPTVRLRVRVTGGRGASKRARLRYQ